VRVSELCLVRVLHITDRHLVVMIVMVMGDRRESESDEGQEHGGERHWRRMITSYYSTPGIYTKAQGMVRCP
jgi:hypothetical protein